MKIRLAKKIMTPSFRNGKIGYWHSRYDLHCMGFDGCRDHRITKAISLTKKVAYGKESIDPHRQQAVV